MSEPSYAGDVGPSEAWDMLVDDTRAVLIDVRTQAKWDHVGRPDLSRLDKMPILVQWQFYPGLRRNSDFAATVLAPGVPRDAPVLLLCRSGARSRKAAIALAELGCARCTNIIGGFEGPRDEQGHRGRLAGWKVCDLPWVQD